MLILRGSMFKMKKLCNNNKRHFTMKSLIENVTECGECAVVGRTYTVGHDEDFAFPFDGCGTRLGHARRSRVTF